MLNLDAIALLHAAALLKFKEGNVRGTLLHSHKAWEKLTQPILKNAQTTMEAKWKIKLSQLIEDLVVFYGGLWQSMPNFDSTKLPQIASF